MHNTNPGANLGDTPMIARVSDMDEGYDFLQDSQDILAVYDYLGIPYDGVYGCLFVKMGDGDYEEIWGCHYYVPGLDYNVYRLK